MTRATCIVGAALYYVGDRRLPYIMMCMLSSSQIRHVSVHRLSAHAFLAGSYSLVACRCSRFGSPTAVYVYDYEVEALVAVHVFNVLLQWYIYYHIGVLSGSYGIYIYAPHRICSARRKLACSRTGMPAVHHDDS